MVATGLFTNERLAFLKESYVWVFKMSIREIVVLDDASHLCCLFRIETNPVIISKTASKSCII